MRLLVYTLLRLGLVLAAAGVLYLLGLRSWVLWIAAVIVGALLSFLVLGRQREGAAAVLAQYDPLREERPAFSPKVEADAAYEDGLVDAADVPDAGPVGPAAPPSGRVDDAAAEEAGRPGEAADRHDDEADGTEGPPAGTR